MYKYKYIYIYINHFTKSQKVLLFSIFLTSSARRRRSPTWRRWSCWPTSQTETPMCTDGARDGPFMLFHHGIHADWTGENMGIYMIKFIIWITSFYNDQYIKNVHLVFFCKNSGFVGWWVKDAICQLEAVRTGVATIIGLVLPHLGLYYMNSMNSGSLRSQSLKASSLWLSLCGHPVNMCGMHGTLVTGGGVGLRSGTCTCGQMWCNAIGRWENVQQTLRKNGGNTGFLIILS